MDVVCSVPECSKQAVFRCPTCMQAGLVSNSFYCSQDCFKGYWPIHQLVHVTSSAQKKFSKFSFTGPLRPGIVSPIVKPPPGIPWPDYAVNTFPKSEDSWDRRKIPSVDSETDLSNLRAAGLLGRRALDYGHSLIKPGITTSEINAAVHAFIIGQGGYPSPLNYRGFPKSICTSVNEVICHGIPDSRPLANGDIINLDVTVFYRGYHADLSETYPVGTVDAESRRLIAAARDALDAGISVCKPGTMYRRIGDAISSTIGKQKFSIVRTYCGHGIGRLFHAPPDISHYPNNKDIGIMRPGHVFTIEPMINAGVCSDMLWPDGWTAVTRDGSRSAQFEHTILITDKGAEVITKRLDDSPPIDI